MVVGQGHLQMENQIRRFADDGDRVIVLAGHYEFGAFLTDLFEDAIIATRQQAVGIAIGFGIVPAPDDQPRQLTANIRRRRRRPWPPPAGDRTFGPEAVVVETAAGAGMASPLSDLFNTEQQHIGITVVSQSLELLVMAAAGSLVP